MIKVSRLRDRIELFEPGAEIDDGFTTRPGGFVSQGERAAEFRPDRVNETLDAGARESTRQASFLVRRDAASRRIDATWKLLFDGESYDVQGVAREDTDGLLIRAVTSDNHWGGGGYST